MIHPVFVPLEPLEVEEDNEPPSLGKRHDFIACPCVCMESPSFCLSSVSKFIQQNPFYSATDPTAISRQGQVVNIALRGSAGNVLTVFPRHSFSGPPQC
jgi:hypothetical protein